MRKSNLVNFKKYEEFYNNILWKPGNYLKLINYSQIPLSWFIKLPGSPYIPLFFKNGEIIFFEKFALHLQVIDLVVINWKLFCSCHLLQGGGGVQGIFVHSCLLLFFHVHVFLENCLTFSHEVLYIFSWYCTDGQYVKNTSLQRCALPQSVFIIFWDFSMFYQIFLSPQMKGWRL